MTRAQGAVHRNARNLLRLGLDNVFYEQADVRS